MDGENEQLTCRERLLGGRSEWGETRGDVCRPQGSIYVSPCCVIASGKADTVSVIEMWSIWLKSGEQDHFGFGRKCFFFFYLFTHISRLGNLNCGKVPTSTCYHSVYYKTTSSQNPLMWLWQWLSDIELHVRHLLASELEIWSPDISYQ